VRPVNLEITTPETLSGARLGNAPKRRPDAKNYRLEDIERNTLRFYLCLVKQPPS
jgi:hypothetical protein